MDELDRRFHRAMIGIYETSKRELGYNATRFLQMLSEQGGVATARQLLWSDAPSDGFTTLWSHGRLDLTVEAALTKLSYLLAQTNLSRAEITDQLSRSIRGEMTEITRPTFSHPSGSLDAAASRLTTAESAFAALGYAIREGEVHSVCDLVSGEGEQLLKQADYAGNTAVHLAAATGDTDIMRELLQRGASVHERNLANNSPLFLATLGGKEDCARLLEAAGAHLSVEELERGPWRKNPS